MKVLIGCERFGVIRDSFIAAGHRAWSCDIARDDSGNNPNADWHIQADIIETIKSFGHGFFDLIILHPDCTALTVAGNHVYAEGKPKHWARQKAIKWTEKLWDTAIEYCQRVALENPQGVLGTQSKLGKAKYIQPYECGDDASKKTGLWTYGLPELSPDPADRFNGRWVEWNGKMVERWSNQTDSGQNKLPPSEGRAMERAKTYPGICKLIVKTWGAFEG